MDWRCARYGALTGGQIERCLAVFREGWSIRKDWEKKWTSEEEWFAAVAKLAVIPNWTGYYQISFLQLIGKLADVSGISDSLISAFRSDDPVGEVLEIMGSMPDDPPDHPEARSIALAMVGNLDSIARFSQSINDLLLAFREKLDIDALFKAISVDSLLTTMPFVQAALRVGQLSADSSAASDLFKAAKGPHKKRMEYPELRWLEYLFRHAGAFSSCSREEIYRLVSEHLRLYDPMGRQEDGKAALFSLFRAWQIEVGIQNPRFGFSVKRK